MVILHLPSFGKRMSRKHPFEIEISIRHLRGLKSKMDSHIIGAQVRIRRIGFPYQKTPALSAVIMILSAGSPFIRLKPYVVIGASEANGIHMHARIGNSHRLKASVLVACRENKVGIMLINYFLPLHTLWSTNGTAGCRTLILRHTHREILIRILYRHPRRIQPDVKLLPFRIESLVRTSRRMASYSHTVITHPESHLQKSFIRFILIIHLKKIIPRHKRFHPFLRECKMIIHEMHESI